MVKNKFYLVKVLKGFKFCVWWFIRVVLHVGSGCQSNIKADCEFVWICSVDLPLQLPVKILYEVDHVFDKLTSRFVSLKINDLGIYRTTTLYKLPEK